MSISQEYASSKLGPMTSFSFTGAAILIRLADPAGGSEARQRSYEIRVTQDARILQGGPAVVATATNAPLVVSTMRRRIDVEVAGLDNYISVIRATTNGTIEISKLSEISTDDAPTLI